MTTTPLTTDESDLAVEAAAAAAAVLPAPEELDVGMPLPATDQLAPDFAGCRAGRARGLGVRPAGRPRR